MYKLKSEKQARVIPLKDEKEKESWRQKQQQFIHTVCFTVRKIHSSRDVRQQFSGRTLYACSEGLNSKEKWRLNLLSQYLIECLLCARHSSKCSSYFNALNPHKKDLHNPDNNSDNHDGMVTHLEPDILECKVKWALGSITTNNKDLTNAFIFFLFNQFRRIQAKTVAARELKNTVRAKANFHALWDS